MFSRDLWKNKLTASSARELQHFSEIFSVWWTQSYHQTVQQEKSKRYITVPEKAQLHVYHSAQAAVFGKSTKRKILYTHIEHWHSTLQALEIRQTCHIFG
jgi:hypothetical protein